MRKRTVIVIDKMQNGYRYTLTAGVGRGFAPEFKPQLTPTADAFEPLGVFCGKYLTDCRREFSQALVRHQLKLARGRRDCLHNFFGRRWPDQPLCGMEASRRLRLHLRRYPRGSVPMRSCRYYTGRRMPVEDARQIKRWKPADRLPARRAQAIQYEIAQPARLALPQAAPSAPGALLALGDLPRAAEKARPVKRACARANPPAHRDR